MFEDIMKGFNTMQNSFTDHSGTTNSPGDADIGNLGSLSSIMKQSAMPGSQGGSFDFGKMFESLSGSAGGIMDFMTSKTGAGVMDMFSTGMEAYGAKQNRDLFEKQINQNEVISNRNFDNKRLIANNDMKDINASRKSWNDNYVPINDFIAERTV